MDAGKVSCEACREEDMLDRYIRPLSMMVFIRAYQQRPGSGREVEGKRGGRRGGGGGGEKASKISRTILCMHEPLASKLTSLASPSDEVQALSTPVKR